VIRLGLRLAVAGGREAVTRLALIGGAVAIGVGLLLIALAGIHAVQAQNHRYNWLNSAATDAATGPEAADPAWFAVRQDYVRGHTTARVDLAATGPDAPIPPGLSRLPAPGEYFVSPALSRLLTTIPADELAGRWSGHPAGLIGRVALPSPESLIVVVGGTPDRLARIDGAVRITRFVSTDPAHCSACYVGTDSDGMILVLSVVAAALIFPLLIFIGTATRLSATRREQRFAAMRLIGATPRQISALATVESAVAAVAGTVLGFGLYFALRSAAAGFTFTGERFYPADLALGWLPVLAVATGVPVGAAVAARLALRRVRISPFGVTRRVTPRPPRAWRLIPVTAGLAELGFFVGRRPESTNGQVYAYLSGIFVVMGGLVIAGPYLTMLGSRVMAARARRPAALIAGRRLADDPRSGFRAVSGLMLALFVTTVATGIITTVTAEEGQGDLSAAARETVALTSYPDELSPGQKPLDASATAELEKLPGVEHALVVRFAGFDHSELPFGLISCADLARAAQYGACPAGAQVGRVWPDLIGPDGIQPTWPAADVTLDRLATLPVVSIAVDTDGTPAAVDRAATRLQQLYPETRPPITTAEWQSDFARTLVQFQRLADVVIITSMLIAGCSLAVAVTGGLNERKRPFSLLRLAGVRLSELRRVVTLESAVPLLAVSAVAIGAGFAAAALFLKAQLKYPLHSPGWSYYVLVLLGLAVSLALIASTMPLLRRITGPEAARAD
jgi:hypothetical protein